MALAIGVSGLCPEQDRKGKYREERRRRSSDFARWIYATCRVYTSGILSASAVVQCVGILMDFLVEWKGYIAVGLRPHSIIHCLDYGKDVLELMPLGIR